MREKTLAILLATYNSEVYLEEQLNSLFSQTYLNWTLYIRDDGSTDRTIDIISSYKKLYNNIVLLEDEKRNLGPKDSFFRLLEEIDADWYMFCDHDDIWLNTKVALTVHSMKECEKNYPDKPVVIHTDLFVVDENLNTISDSFWQYSGINVHRIQSFNYLSVCNKVTGCTMMLNKKAKLKSFPVSKNCLMHDSWIALCCMANNGRIESVSESTILYRQHTQNQIGATKVNFKYYTNKVFSIHKVVKENLGLYKMARSIKKMSLITFLIHKLLYIFYRNVGYN